MEKAGIEPHPVFKRIGKIISEIAAKSHQDLAGMGGELREDLYPPCIKVAGKGVDAGSRNYAVTVLLTSFLSHARISPFAGDAKISDFIDDISIISDEILPGIYEAGARCNPPLFDDQPVEKANILYHLGFGLIQNPRLGDSGNSTWYIPPNCEKVQREIPLICSPDALCRRIKNPMNYYVIKARDSSREAPATESGDAPPGQQT
jgi:DNA primase large subunit